MGVDSPAQTDRRVRKAWPARIVINLNLPNNIKSKLKVRASELIYYLSNQWTFKVLFHPVLYYTYKS